MRGNTKYKKNELFFSSPNPENCYWAGFIAGDGCVNAEANSVVIALSTKDRQLLERFKEETELTVPIRHYSYTRNTGKIQHTCSLTIGKAQQWIHDLNIHFNITPRKSFTLEPPHISTKELVIPYLVGFIDANGTIGRYVEKSGSEYFVLNISTASIYLIDWLEKWIKLIEPSIACNSLYKKRSQKGKKDHFCIHITHNVALKVLQALNKDYHGFQLNRKWSKLQTPLYKITRVGRNSYCRKTLFDINNQSYVFSDGVFTINPEWQALADQYNKKEELASP